MTVVPLFCAQLHSAPTRPARGRLADHARPPRHARSTAGPRASTPGSTARFDQFPRRLRARAWRRPQGAAVLTVLVILLGAVRRSASRSVPFVGLAYFPRTDPGQFVINVKTATGTRLEVTERGDQQAGRPHPPRSRSARPAPHRLQHRLHARLLLASTRRNSATHTAFVQVGLNDDHKIGSYEYMDRVRARRAARDARDHAPISSPAAWSTPCSTSACPRPSTCRSAAPTSTDDYAVAQKIGDAARQLPGVSDVLIPQDIDAPSLQLNIDRVRASELGLTQKEVVSNVITALTSNAMIAPSYWIDPKTGNDYLLTVQYPENTVETLQRPAQHPAARPEPDRSHPPRHGGRHHEDRSRRPKSTTTSCAARIDVYIATEAGEHRHASRRRSKRSSARMPEPGERPRQGARHGPGDERPRSAASASDCSSPCCWFISSSSRSSARFSIPSSSCSPFRRA